MLGTPGWLRPSTPRKSSCRLAWAITGAPRRSGRTPTPSGRELSRRRLLRRDVVVVHDVTFNLLDRDVPEAGLRHQLACLLLAQSCAETFAAEGQRHRHAVHGGDQIG